LEEDIGETEKKIVNPSQFQTV